MNGLLQWITYLVGFGVGSVTYYYIIEYRKRTKPKVPKVESVFSPYVNTKWKVFGFTWVVIDVTTSPEGPRFAHMHPSPPYNKVDARLLVKLDDLVHFAERFDGP